MTDETLAAVARKYAAKRLAEASAARVGEIKGARHLESLRRDRLRLIRRELAGAGYKGVARLVSEHGRFAIVISPPRAVDEQVFRVDLSADLSETEDAIADQARRLADLGDIARRRADAILLAGGDLMDPPSWAYLGHPVARGAYASMGLDLAGFRPRHADDPGRCRLGTTLAGFHIKVAGMRLAHMDTTIHIDAADTIARIRVFGGDWPETLIEAMSERPVGDVLGLPGLERGTRAGDSPIRKAWREKAGFGITVDCPLEPMGTVPDGVDAGFLDEWRERHCG